MRGEWEKTASEKIMFRGGGGATVPPPFRLHQCTQCMLTCMLTINPPNLVKLTVGAQAHAVNAQNGIFLGYVTGLERSDGSHGVKTWVLRQSQRDWLKSFGEGPECVLLQPRDLKEDKRMNESNDFCQSHLPTSCNTTAWRKTRDLCETSSLHARALHFLTVLPNSPYLSNVRQ